MGSTIEKAISDYGYYIGVGVGNSMYPMLRNRVDSVRIVKAGLPLKKYDLPLYKRDDGKYVLHRIVKTNTTGYVMCGDNRFSREYGITDRHIIGVTAGFYRGERYIPADNFWYLLYTRIWVFIFPIRRVISKIKRIFCKGKKY